MPMQARDRKKLQTRREVLHLVDEAVILDSRLLQRRSTTIKTASQCVAAISTGIAVFGSLGLTFLYLSWILGQALQYLVRLHPTLPH
jgi:hypothetical protein